MFFKNITIFNIKQEIDFELLNKSLSENPYMSCPSSQRSSSGFVHPFINNHDECVHKVNSSLLFCLKTEEKILPAQVINEHLKEKVASLEGTQTNKISKDEKTRIKEDIEQQLLPRAFTKSKLIYAYFDNINKLLIIDSASDKAIKDILSSLKKAFDSLSVELVADNISKVLTEWFSNNLSVPKDIEINNKCKLISDEADGMATISCQGNAMLSENIIAFVNAGGSISEIAITWQDKVNLSLTNDFKLKNIKFNEELKDSNQGLSKNDKIAKDEADFLIMAETFGEIINDLKLHLNQENRDCK